MRDAAMLIHPHFALLRSTGQPLADVRRFLRAVDRLDTLKHAAQVAAAGRRLARRFGLSLAKSDLACAAHDMAGVVPLREILSVAQALDVPLGDDDRAIPQVVHGPVAAAALQRVLGVDDEDVLNAVRYHTTLRAGASPLEQLVFIADKIALDPTTRHAGFHPALLDERDKAPLPELCLIYLDWAVREGPGLGWRLHSNLVGAWEALKRADEGGG
jgi:predicted HD superfamily hydrolase involved in NAD metabolism